MTPRWRKTDSTRIIFPAEICSSKWGREATVRNSGQERVATARARICCILKLGFDTKPQEMLRLGGIIDNGSGAAQDFTVSPDWTQAVQYDQEGDQGDAGPWSSTTWCLGKSVYERCGHKDTWNHQIRLC